MFTQTRGEKNCNPGNIERRDITWQGMASAQTDPRFIVFTKPEYGIRALAKTLLTYYRLHGLDTVHGIITRWAPSEENDTQAYINHVASLLNVTPDDRINLEDSSTLVTLTKAIIAHENGRVAYPDAVIEDGVDQALA